MNIKNIILFLVQVAAKASATGADVIDVVNRPASHGIDANIIPPDYDSSEVLQHIKDDADFYQAADLKPHAQGILPDTDFNTNAIIATAAEYMIQEQQEQFAVFTNEPVEEDVKLVYQSSVKSTDASMVRVTIPKSMLDIAGEYLPEEHIRNLQESDHHDGRELTVEQSVAETIQNIFKTIKEMRVESRKSSNNIDSNDEALIAHSDNYYVRVPLSGNSDNKRSLQEAEENIENRNLNEYENIDNLVEILGQEDLPISQMHQYRVDMSHLNRQQKTKKIIELQQAGYIVDIDGKEKITDNLRGAEQFDPVKLAKHRDLVAGSKVSDQRCIFILDTCTVTDDKWKQVGFKDKQLKFTDNTCTPNYNIHGSASVYAAWQGDSDATFYFWSVFNSYGMGSRSSLVAKREQAADMLIKEKLKGKCQHYAGMSFSGSGFMDVSEEQIVKDYSPTLKLLKKAGFYLDAAAAGNDGSRYYDKHTFCKWVSLPYMRMLQGKNHKGPLSIISSYFESGDDKWAPFYANDDGSKNICVDYLVKTEVDVPGQVYKHKKYGGTSRSTAASNGIYSDAARMLRAAGYNYGPEQLWDFMKNLQKGYTESSQDKDESGPVSPKYNLGKVILEPGYPIWSEETIRAAIKRLIDGAPMPTRSPTQKKTSSPMSEEYEYSMDSNTPHPTSHPTLQPTLFPTDLPWTQPPSVEANGVSLSFVNRDKNKVHPTIFMLSNKVGGSTEIKFDPVDSVKGAVKNKKNVWSLVMHTSKGQNFEINIGQRYISLGKDLSLSGIVVDSSVADKLVLSRKNQVPIRMKKYDNGWVLQVKVSAVPETWQTAVTMPNNVGIDGAFQIKPGVPGTVYLSDAESHSPSKTTYEYYKYAADALNAPKSNTLTKQNFEMQVSNAKKGIILELNTIGVLDEMLDTSNDGLGSVLNEIKGKYPAQQKSIDIHFSGNDKIKKVLKLALALYEERKNLPDSHKQRILRVAYKGNDNLATYILNLSETPLFEIIKRLDNAKNLEQVKDNILRQLWYEAKELNHPSQSSTEDLAEFYEELTNPDINDNDDDVEMKNSPEDDAGEPKSYGPAIAGAIASVVSIGIALYNRERLEKCCCNSNRLSSDKGTEVDSEIYSPKKDGFLPSNSLRVSNQKKQHIPDDTAVNKDKTKKSGKNSKN